MAIATCVVLSWATGNVGSSREREGRLFNLHDFKSDLTSFYIMRGLTKTVFVQFSDSLEIKVIPYFKSATEERVRPIFDFPGVERCLLRSAWTFARCGAFYCPAKGLAPAARGCQWCRRLRLLRLG